jgi:hypothetical protein
VTNSEGVIVRNNAFIGFGGDNGVVYLNENSTPLDSALKLNMLSELSECARGGNVEYDTIEEVGFLSTDDDSAGFLVPAQGSVLVGAGLELPILCEDIEVLQPETDLEGDEVPCESTFDMGCYEYCP